MTGYPMRFAALHRLVAGHGRSALGLQKPELVEKLLEPLPVLGPVDAVGRGAEDAHALFLERHRELERRLAAELHDHAHGLLPMYNM